MLYATIIILAVVLLLLFKKIINQKNISLKQIWNFIKDWRTFISFLIAWIITNGWGYLFVFFGSLFKIKWMRIVGLSYIAFLWLPTTPEKLVTIPLGLFIKKILFKKH